MNKEKFICNILKIIQLELDNYNMNADYGYELDINDIINYYISKNK